MLIRDLQEQIARMRGGAIGVVGNSGRPVVGRGDEIGLMQRNFMVGSYNRHPQVQAY